VFAKYGVPLFVDKGRSSLGKPIFTFVQSALRLISPERYFRQEDMLTFLKTGLCGEDRDLISRLENYCILWQVNGERFVREADWTQNPMGQGPITSEGSALLAELNALRRRVREPLLRFKEQAAAPTGKSLAKAIYDLLCDFKVEEHIATLAQQYLEQSTAGQNAWETQQNRRLSREYLKLYGMMADILDDIYTVFGDTPISLYAMEELIALCGEETVLNVTPPTLDAVMMGEVAHSRMGDLHSLYVVGANQGLLPMPVADTGLIGDRERRLFVANDLPCNATLQQNTLQGQYRFYAAVFSVRQQLTFSYSAFTIGGEALMPSVYLDRLKQLTGLAPLLRSDMELYDFAVTPEGARELTGWEPALRADILAELQEHPLPPQDPKNRLPAEVVRRIFGDRLRLSYSQISLYQNCPFHYFMEKTMGIRPLEPITFDAANIGTFVHYGMEKLVQALREQNFDYAAYTPVKIQQFGEALATEYLQEQLRDFNRTNRFNALYRRMTGLFCLVAQNVLGELREGGFVPYGEEVSLAGAEIPLKNGAVAELIGSVDRVDTYQDGEKTYIKVTDYKTGSKTFDLRGVTNRDGVQLPIYLYGLIKSGRWQNPVPAAGCYMEAKTPAFTEPVKPEELEQKLQSFYRRNGAFTADEQALCALDAAKGSRYFKISYNKDGSLKKDQKVYDPAFMQELVDYMETVIRQTAEGILSGEASVDPLKGKEHNACRYCNFAAVCRHDPQNGACREYSEEPLGWKEVQA
jgi:ATP-dependent helicase/nuclease subunit B